MFVTVSFLDILDIYSSLESMVTCVCVCVCVCMSVCLSDDVSADSIQGLAKHPWFRNATLIVQEHSSWFSLSLSLYLSFSLSPSLCLCLSLSPCHPPRL